MRRPLFTILAAAFLTVSIAAIALSQTTTTTTTTATKTVQNPDGTYTVIEYPVKKEVQLSLNAIGVENAKGVATIIRDDDGTKIKLNLTNIPSAVTSLSLYAVDESGKLTELGPIAISNGVGTLATSTPLTKFMLLASPEPLATYDSNTAVLFRSTVPEGFTVIPMTRAEGERVAAVATPSTTVVTPTTTVVAPTAPTATVVTPVVTPAAPTTTTTVVATPTAPAAAPATGPVLVATPGTTVVATTTSYKVPMLNIPSYKTGDDTKVKVDFTGAMTGARANVFITPRKDGPTEVKMRFHELKEAPAGQKFILWAVTAENKFIKLGQVVNTPSRNEAEIKSEVAESDFGLVVTMEDADADSPKGPAVGNIHIVP
jgi:hypothetical protein